MIDAHRDEAPQETGGPSRPKRQKRERHKARPTVGRIIHVVADQGLAAKLNAQPGMHLAAIVTLALELSPGFNATVFSPFGNPPTNGYPLRLAHEGTTWHWPERDA